MNRAPPRLDGLEVGFDIPAMPGMRQADVQTPCLILDLDALDRNIRKMGDHARTSGVRHRVHAKMHKSVDIAKLQIELGGACGICCQKVSEAEVFVRGGIKDVLLTNQVRDLAKIDRLARLPTLGARVICCVDDIDNVADLSAAAIRHGVRLECLVELDCGARRCGTQDIPTAVAIAKAIDTAPGLTFSGLQAYNGAIQHLTTHAERRSQTATVIGMVRKAVLALNAEGLQCAIVGGAGTGTYRLESGSGVFNELQCGSYAFMDAAYGRIRDEGGVPFDTGEWQNALFVLTAVMSRASADRAIVDAGLKALAVDSGLPEVFGRDDIAYIQCNDEHGVVEDLSCSLRVNDKLSLVPGHCDPTCNLHDWYVGLRGGAVECLWPISARGKVY